MESGLVFSYFKIASFIIVLLTRRESLLGDGFLKLQRNNRNNYRVWSHLLQNCWVHRNSDLEGSLREKVPWKVGLEVAEE